MFKSRFAYLLIIPSWIFMTIAISGKSNLFVLKRTGKVFNIKFQLVFGFPVFNCFNKEWK